MLSNQVECCASMNLCIRDCFEHQLSKFQRRCFWSARHIPQSMFHVWKLFNPIKGLKLSSMYRVQQVHTLSTVQIQMAVAWQTQMRAFLILESSLVWNPGIMGLLRPREDFLNFVMTIFRKCGIPGPGILGLPRPREDCLRVLLLLTFIHPLWSQRMPPSLF